MTALLSISPMLKTVGASVFSLTASYCLVNNQNLSTTAIATVGATVAAIAVTVFASTFGVCATVGGLIGLFLSSDPRIYCDSNAERIILIAISTIMGSTMGYTAGSILSYIGNIRLPPITPVYIINL